MAIGSVLLQPQRLERAGQIPADDAILDDIINLGIRLGVDAASNDGRLSEVISGSIPGTAERLIGNAGAGLDRAIAHFQAMFAPLITSFQAAADTAPGDVSAVLGGVESGLTGAATILKNLSPVQLRALTNSFFAILEDDLGITPTFVRDVALGFFDAMVLALQTAPPNEIAAQRENRRAVAALIGRVKRYIGAHFVFPTINADAAAAALLKLRHMLDVDAALDRLVCATEGAAAYLRAGESVLDVLPYSAFPAFGEGSLGAAATPPQREEYSFYASKLLENDNYDGDLGELPLPADEIFVNGVTLPNLREAFKSASVVLARSAFLYAVDTGEENTKWRVVDRKKYTLHREASHLIVYPQIKIDVNDFLGSLQSSLTEFQRMLHRHGVLQDPTGISNVHEEGSNTWTFQSGIFSYRGTRFQGDVTVTPANLVSALFELPVALQPSTESEPSPELREAFESRGIPLTSRVKLSVVEAGSEWLLDDDEYEYTIEKDEGKFKVSMGGALSWFRVNLLSVVIPINGDSVWVNKERTQVLLGRRIMHVGENVSWEDAPIFKKLNGNRYYSLKNSAGTVEDWVWYTSWINDALGFIVDAVKVGISIDQDKMQYSITSNVLDAIRKISEMLVKQAQHMPMKDLIGSPVLYDLLYDLGLIAVGIIESAVSPKEAETPEEASANDFSKFLDTVFGIAAGIEIVDTHWSDLIYKFILSTLTLVNHVEPDPPSKKHPENYKESGGFVELFWHVGLMIYAAAIPDDEYALPFQTSSLTGGYCLGGASGVGLVMGFVGLLVGQCAVAGVNIGTDGGQIAKTLFKSWGKSLLYFWGYLKLFKGKN